MNSALPRGLPQLTVVLEALIDTGGTTINPNNPWEFS
jgi:hypothetical protein